MIERGRSVDRRSRDVDVFWTTGKLDPVSNVQFGEGGAGAFSDGKLTTGIKDPRCAEVLQQPGTRPAHRRKSSTRPSPTSAPTGSGAW